MATVMDSKGLREIIIDRVSRFIKETGYLRLTYKSDQEVSIRAMLESAVLKSGREGTLEQATAENSAVGESQSNGRAESAVGLLEDRVRTYKACLEYHTWAARESHQTTRCCTGSWSMQLECTIATW